MNATSVSENRVIAVFPLQSDMIQCQSQLLPELLWTGTPILSNQLVLSPWSSPWPTTLMEATAATASTKQKKEPPQALRRWKQLTKTVLTFMEAIVTAAMRMAFLTANYNITATLEQQLNQLGYAQLTVAAANYAGMMKARVQRPVCPLCGRGLKAAVGGTTGKKVMLCNSYPLCRGMIPIKQGPTATVDSLTRRADRCPHWSEEKGSDVIKKYGNPSGRYARCELCKRRWKWENDAWQVRDDFALALKAAAKQKAAKELPTSGPSSEPGLPSSSRSSRSSSGPAPSASRPSGGASAPTSRSTFKRREVSRPSTEEFTRLSEEAVFPDSNHMLEAISLDVMDTDNEYDWEEIEAPEEEDKL